MTTISPPALVVAGTASSVGKTTVTLGLLAALRRRGLIVQPFKVGPDFIDPGLHEIAAGRPSYSLDAWMCGREHVVALVASRAAGADLCLVEGVMGCFDGVDGTSDEGSTAQIAKWLGAPVILIVDASAQSRSVAATVQGFERFFPELEVAGVIFNRVGGDRHARWLAEAVANACRARPLGALRHEDGLLLPERHLGLHTAAEGVLTEARRRRLAEACERFVDLDALRALGHSRGRRRPSRRPPRPRSRGSAWLATRRSSSTTRRTSNACVEPAPSSYSGARSRMRAPRKSMASTWGAATRSCTVPDSPPTAPAATRCEASQRRAGRSTPSAAG